MTQSAVGEAFFTNGKAEQSHIGLTWIMGVIGMVRASG